MWIGSLKEKQNGIKQKGFDTMKTIKKYLYLTLFLILIFSLSSTNNLKVESASLDAYTHIWKEDTLINSFDQLENSFYISDSMEISQFTMDLKLKKSPTLIGDLSSLSVLVNNIPVHSINMDSLDESGVLKINIPNNLIQNGRNSIIIKGFLKSTRDKCEFNPDINWIIIEKDSYFSFKSIRRDSKYINNIFENTYYPDGLRGFVQLAIPEKTNGENYNQIASISSLIGYIHRDKEVDLRIKPMRYSDLNKTNRESIIIGNPDQIKSFNKDLFSEEEWKHAKSNGFIGLREIGDRSHFLLITSNNTQLETLIGILQDKVSLSQIEDINYILDESKIVNRPDFITKSTFKNLGYETFSQSGSGMKEFNYYLTIPANQTLTKDNKFIFNYNYSPLLENEDAFVTVEINDNKLLSKEILTDSDKGRLEFSIPEKYFDSIGFNISLKFNLAPEDDNCITNNYEDLWVKVDSEDSYYDLQLEDRSEYSLLNAQGLFQDANGFIEGNINIDDYKNLSFNSICNFSSYLGQVSQGVNKLTLNSGDKAIDGKGAIIGLNFNPLIQSERDNIQIPPSENGEFINKDLFIQNTDNLGLIGISLDNNKLIITANNEKELNLTIQEYEKISNPNKSVILKNGKTIDQFNGLEEIEDPEKESTGIDYNILIASITLLLFTIISFWIYFKKIKH